MSRTNNLAIVASGSLLVQTILFAVAFRYARRHESAVDFSNLSVLVASEAVKMICSWTMIAWDHGLTGSAETFMKLAVHDVRGSCMTSLPGLLYAVQNLLFFIGISNLSVALYQVEKQVAILVTALLSVVVMKKSLSTSQWGALVLLSCGVATATLKGDMVQKGSFVIGSAAVVGGCLLSGLATVCTELMLKAQTHSIWERNVQLSFFGLLFGVLNMTRETGGLHIFVSPEFFAGWNPWVFTCVFCQSCGGIFTAAVLKYTDSVMKCVVKSVAVLISIALSRILFQEGPFLTSVKFQAGAIMAIAGTAIYSLGWDKLVAPLRFSAFKYSKAASKSEEDPERGVAAVVGKARSRSMDEDPENEEEQEHLRDGASRTP